LADMRMYQRDMGFTRLLVGLAHCTRTGVESALCKIGPERQIRCLAVLDCHTVIGLVRKLFIDKLLARDCEYGFSEIRTQTLAKRSPLKGCPWPPM